jgi:hypothetical protein
MARSGQFCRNVANGRQEKQWRILVNAVSNWHLIVYERHKYDKNVEFRASVAAAPRVVRSLKRKRRIVKRFPSLAFQTSIRP